MVLKEPVFLSLFFFPSRFLCDLFLSEFSADTVQLWLIFVECHFILRPYFLDIALVNLVAYESLPDSLAQEIQNVFHLIELSKLL